MNETGERPPRRPACALTVRFTEYEAPWLDEVSRGFIDEKKPLMIDPWY